MAKHAEAVTIIGGADGPTSVFLVGKTKGKKKLKYRIRDYFFKKKKRRIEKTITANPHTLYEVADYIKSQYHGVELSGEERRFLEEKNGLKTALILEHNPELLGDLGKVDKPNEATVDAVKEFMHRIELRQEAAEIIPADKFPMDFHVFEINYPQGGTINISLENIWGHFSVSCSGSSKKIMKQLKYIV